MASRAGVLLGVAPVGREYDDEIAAGDCGIDSSIRLKAIFIHSFEDTLWWIGLLTDKLTEPDDTAVARQLLLSRMSFVLDVFREQIAVHRRVLRELGRECGPPCEGAVAHLRQEYESLLPLLEAVAGGVTGLDQSDQRRATEELKRRSARLLEATRAVLHDDTMVVSRSQLREADGERH